ncbi:hypothetical protein jhhlp_004963 [Lomentospora prolificans]|uniref:DUF676 domain-containing protein n=1 Tax=Lomentospora prolificans TaxID=41688 RepID=A0A2N3N861_9PEZI|nr:hypothetical protein jhhlp_004963 [Lomentospora prolificans]
MPLWKHKKDSKAKKQAGAGEPTQALVPVGPQDVVIASPEGREVELPSKLPAPETRSTHARSTQGAFGLDILHQPVEPVADIIFIHGLTGTRDATWTRNAGKRTACFWPKDLLPDSDHGIPEARIASWGYDANVVDRRPFGVVSTNSIEQHAANLCADLANFRRGAEANRPLIFVVHSLGGLVLKTALLHANESRANHTSHIAAVADSTAAIAFMGTPHRGSEQAQWGSILASALNYVKQDNSELVKRLNKEEPRLDLLQERFMKFLEWRKDQARPINITCFYEELPLPVIGTIVPAASAKIDPYDSIGIHENHKDMVRFGGDDSPGYIKVVGELRRWIDALKQEAEAEAALVCGNPSPLLEKRHGTKQQQTNGIVPAQAQGSPVHHSGNVANGGVAFYGSQLFSGQQLSIGGFHYNVKNTQDNT